MAAGRAAILLAVAVALGFFVLKSNDSTPSARVSTQGPKTSATVPPNATSTTVATLPLRAPREIKVLVANTTRVKGAAGRISDVLQGQGYNTLSPTDAPSVPETLIYYDVGYEREAVEVARALTLAVGRAQAMPVPPPIALNAANILVMVGPDVAGPEPTTTTAKKTTTTTAKAGATTTAKPAATSTTRAPTTTARPATTTTRAPATTGSTTTTTA